MHFRFFNKKVLFAIKVCIALLILFVLVKKISISEIYNALQSAAWPYVLFALLLLPVNIFLQYKRWQLLVRLDNVQSRNGEIFLSLLAGMTLGFITPGRVGEYGRCFFIKQGCWPRLLGFIVVEKFISIFFIYLLGIVGFFIAFSSIPLYRCQVVNCRGCLLYLLFDFVFYNTPCFIKKVVPAFSRPF